ncbi:DUF2508 family protein [Caldisalinibacter kiritimatiensis]|uniref:DUF2508 domain-containing protein n=1 Tax=Caldisalinibacter kiritimatiensis TaxID=1304284 RepID=R1CE63_9FIRM|nr:DUF2508 family protein [Caldisalinibacter kiritimatiensis]EOD00575.1 hypothetical protein L21TH_1375 [Caldisalinibacter kiritimatiensis]
MEETTLYKKDKKIKDTNNFKEFIVNIRNKIINQEKDTDLLNKLKEAHTEWVNAELYFKSVTDPDLIDYAVFNIEAARKKYIYLLKQARKEGLEINKKSM